MNSFFLYDKKRNKGGGYVIRFLFFLRLASATHNSVVKAICNFIIRHYRLRYGLEILPKTVIGKGLYLGHAYNITINPESTIGDNCNIHKGVLIGSENRGKRIGAPKIGNKVWIGVNSAIVGNVKIGDDVLIAPCSYVNIDVPSHSVVFGNPCVVKHRDNATEGYINNIV